MSWLPLPETCPLLPLVQLSKICETRPENV